MRAIAALMVALGAVAVTPASATACSALVPTFQQTLDGASRIVLGTVTAAVNTDASSHPDEFTIRVERALRGPETSSIVVDQPAYLCGDKLGPDSVGRRVIIATDVRYFRMTLSPFWWERRPGVLDGFAEYPPDVSTIEELADRIAAALPDTSTHTRAAQTPDTAPWIPALVGLIGLVWFLRRPFTRGRAS